MNDYVNLRSVFFSGVLLTVGYWRIFKKCGVKPFWAFSPFAREYQIALCSDRRNDGLVFAFMVVVECILRICISLAEGYTELDMFLLIPTITVMIVRIIYMARIYVGLAEVFGRSKKWGWLFVFFEVPMVLIWGFHLSMKFNMNL